MGTLAEQLEAKGMTPRNVALQIAIAKFQNNGGEYGVALAMLNAAYGKGGKVALSSPEGRTGHADAPRTNDGEDHRPDAAEADPGTPSPSPDRSAGQRSAASSAKMHAPVAAKLPGHAKRGLHAIGAVQEAVSRSLFDTTKLPDGRRLRDGARVLRRSTGQAMTAPAFHIVADPPLRTFHKQVCIDPERGIWITRHITVPDYPNPADLRRALAEQERRIDGK